MTQMLLIYMVAYLMIQSWFVPFSIKICLSIAYLLAYPSFALMVTLIAVFYTRRAIFQTPKMVLLEKKNYQYNGGYLTSTLIIFQKDYLECIGKAQSEQSSSGRISNSGYF